jgi:hypothetical protein
MQNISTPSRITTILLTDDYVYAIDSWSASVVRWPKNPSATNDQHALIQIIRVNGEIIALNRRVVSFVVGRSDQVITIEDNSDINGTFEMVVYNCTVANSIVRSDTPVNWHVANSSTAFVLSLDNNNGNIIVQGPGVIIQE